MRRRRGNNKNNYSPDDIDREFAELTSRLGPMDDPTVGPRDYTLAPDTTPFDPADLTPPGPAKPLVIAALAAWAVVIIVPVIFGLARTPLPLYLKIALGIFVVVAIVLSYFSLRKQPHSQDDEDGAQV